MSATHLALCLTLSATLLAAPGDRAPRGSTAGVRAHVPPAPGVPEFALFGWVSPPADSTDLNRMTELAGTGMNLALPAWDDSGKTADNLHRLDLAAATGMKCLIWERRFERFLTLDVKTPAGQALLDSIVATYRSHPAFAGYYLGDEPPVAEFPLLADLHAQLRIHDPDHPAWNNLIGPSSFPTHAAWEGTTRDYLDQTRAAVLCDDQYDFTDTGDRMRFVENAAALGALSRERGIPFWAIVQLVAHAFFRELEDGELRWQVSTLLAYGARGVGYFTYWTPAPDTVWNWQPAIIGWDGVRTHWYDTVARFNARVIQAGNALARLDWVAAEHAGSVPPSGVAFRPDAWLTEVRGRAVLGKFADSTGTRFLVVANSDSSNGQWIWLTFPFAAVVDELAADGSWAPLFVPGSVPSRGLSDPPRLGLYFDPGDYTVLRLRGGMSLAEGGPGPVLRIAPNPADGAALFVTARVGARAKLAVVDAAGRRIWTRTLASGSTAITWRGERDLGGPAPPGVYFVRIEDERGATLRRFSWLGRP